MEQRDYLKRAQAFLRSATKLSLKVAPLALAAANVVHAGSIDPPSYNFISGSAYNVSCSGGCYLSGGSPVGNSTALPGIASMFIDTSDIYYSTSGGSGTLGIFWQGLISPNLPDGYTTPFSWDFTLFGANQPVSWNLILSGALNGFASGGTSQLTTLELGSPFSGSGTATTSSSTGILTVELDVNLAANDFVDVYIPGGKTIDVNLNPASVPEPASAMLIAPALGGLFLVLRRRKRA